MTKQELLPDDIKDQLPKLYAQEDNKDPTVCVKFFCPWNQWTWYATEGQAEGEDFLFFGYVVGFEREWGYFSLNEMQNVTGPFGLKIERDMHFTPKPASEISDIHSHYKPKNDGVKKQYCGHCEQDTLHEGRDCLACGNHDATDKQIEHLQAILKKADSENLADKKCRACGEQYDNPHKTNCSQRRNPSTSTGEPRVLVKMEDL